MAKRPPHTPRPPSPFVTYRGAILEQERLQALTLHLYNSDEWPFNLGHQLSQFDRERLAIATALMKAFNERGENDPEFLALGRQLAEYRIERRRQFDAELAELDEEVRRDTQE